jgi:hypothetical protein
MHRLNEEHFNRFIDFIYDPSIGCLEFVAWKADISRSNFIEPATRYPKTIGSWYDRLDSLRCDISRLNGVSGYICVNPVNPDLLARSRNQAAPIRKGQGTKESDIVSYRHFLIDIDTERRSGISATDIELKRAYNLRDLILEREERIRQGSIWGCSGNGCYILGRIEEPNARVTKDIVQNTLRSLAYTYGKQGRNKAFIDTQTVESNRHLGIPGTLKCKGAHTDERPHRLITVDGWGNNTGIS